MSVADGHGGDGGADAAKSATSPEKSEEKTPENANGEGSGDDDAPNTKQTNGSDAPPPVVELAPEVRARLKKLDKVEMAYKSTSMA